MGARPPVAGGGAHPLASESAHYCRNCLQFGGSDVPNQKWRLIRIQFGTTVLGTGIVDRTGSFDIITSPIADGIYSFQAIVRIGGVPQTSAGFPPVSCRLRPSSRRWPATSPLTATPSAVRNLLLRARRHGVFACRGPAAPNGMVGFAWNTLREAFCGEQSDCLLD